LSGEVVTSCDGVARTPYSQRCAFSEPHDELDGPEMGRLAFAQMDELKFWLHTKQNLPA